MNIDQYIDALLKAGISQETDFSSKIYNNTIFYNSWNCNTNRDDKYDRYNILLQDLKYYSNYTLKAEQLTDLCAMLNVILQIRNHLYNEKWDYFIPSPLFHLVL